MYGWNEIFLPKTTSKYRWVWKVMIKKPEQTVMLPLVGWTLYGFVFLVRNLKVWWMFQILNFRIWYLQGLAVFWSNQSYMFLMRMMLACKNLVGSFFWPQLQGMHLAIKTKPGLQLWQTNLEVITNVCLKSHRRLYTSSFNNQVFYFSVSLLLLIFCC